MPRGGASGRERLDQLLVARGLAPSRAKAQALVLAGQVLSRGVRLEKAGTTYPRDIPLELVPGRRYVGRGGHKLVAALSELGVRAEARDALDVGASTGGFTQVLLEAGAARVIALDVGRGQLDFTLRRDPSVYPLEGLNARYLQPADLPFPPSLAVVDVSFISLRLVLPAVVACLTPPEEIVALIKPQFEVGRREVGRGGIVRDPRLHEQVLRDIASFVRAEGWGLRGVCASALPGSEGNREFFVHAGATDTEVEDAALSRRIRTICEPRETEG